MKSSTLIAAILSVSIVAFLGPSYLVTAIVVFVATILLAEAQKDERVGAVSNVFFATFLKLFSHQKSTRPQKILWKPYTIILGRDIETGKVVAPKLDELGSSGVACQTRFGKTTFLHSELYNLLRYHTPDQLKIALVDPEQFDFALFASVPHLYRPIARTQDQAIELLMELDRETERRGAYFSSLATEYLCNDIHRYHELIDKYGLVLPRLPYIFFIFDEFQRFVRPKSPEEEIMIKLGQIGQKRGIFLQPATQRPTADVWAGNLKANLTSIFIGYMSSSLEYGVVSKVPAEIYEKMQYVKGRFATKIEGRWFILQGNMVDDTELAEFTKSISVFLCGECGWRGVGRGLVTAMIVNERGETKPTILCPRCEHGVKRDEPKWPDRDMDVENLVPVKTALRGSRVQKLAQVQNWALSRNTEARPTANEFMAAFDVTENTALRWINEVWKEW